MASVADLNIRLGLIYDKLDKGLEQVERKLRTSGKRLSQLGDDLTLSLSAPLALLGASAVTAAGDIQSLQLAMASTFENAGRSVTEANKELDALRKSALAPGLDFEQAVKASIRLQGVEYSAEAARKTIEGVANAVSLTGGTSANLESVTVQFSQMISKGKVLSADLRIIQENMPIISKLMKQAFGTSNAEDIQALGITGKEFVDTISKEMEKLPRVAGGISNAIVNAFTSVKAGIAKIGFAIDKTFDITAQSERFGVFVTSVADGFANLSPGLQKFIIEFGLIVVAIGPAIKVIGIFKSLGAQVIDAFQGVLSVLRGVAGGAINSALGFSRLNLAMKLTAIGAAIAIITTLYFAYDKWTNSMTDAERAQQSVEQVTSAANASIAEQKSRTDLLIGVLKDENTTYAERKKALAELQTIAPKYFGSLDLEKSKIEDIVAAQQRYIASILSAAKAQAAREKLVELAREELAIEERRGKLSQGEQFALGLKGISNKNSALAEQNRLLDAQLAPINAQKEALVDVVLANEQVAETEKKTTEETKKMSGQMGEASKKAKLYAEVMSDVRNVSAQQDLLGSKDILEQASAIESGIKRLLDGGFAPLSTQVQGLKAQMQGLFSQIKLPEIPLLPTLPTPTSVTSEAGGPSGPRKVDGSGVEQYLSFAEKLGKVNADLQGSMIKFGEAFSQVGELVASQGSLMQQVFLGMSSAISDAALSGEVSFKKLGLAAAGAAVKIVRAYIQQGVAAAVAKALGGLPFPLNIAAGAAAGGIAAALFSKAIGSLGVPALAQGGLAHAPTLAMVGDNRNARIDPEVIAPLSKLKNMLGGSSIDLNGEFVIRGTDLVVVLDRAQAKRNRRQ